MEVQFVYTRDDWTAITMKHYKDWLYSRRPLSNVEYRLCWFLLLFSLLAGVGCLAFLGWSIWLNQAWYFVVGSVVVLVFLGGMVLEILNPRREAVRGLFIEWIFRQNWEEKLIETVRRRRDRHYRRLEEKGQLNLDHRFLLYIDPEGYTLTVDYPTTTEVASRQVTRQDWRAVTSVHLDEGILFFKIGDAGYQSVPCSAFLDDATCQLFAGTSEAYRTKCALGGGEQGKTTDEYVAAEVMNGMVAH
jgi:hypothetical protein